MRYVYHYTLKTTPMGNTRATRGRLIFKCFDASRVDVLLATYELQRSDVLIERRQAPF